MLLCLLPILLDSEASFGSLRENLCLIELNMLPCFSEEELEGVLDKLPVGITRVVVAMLAVCDKLMSVSGTGRFDLGHLIV